jgi:hypothetical protein
MIVFTRYESQWIAVGSTGVLVRKVSPARVSLGILAPRDVPIIRGETGGVPARGDGLDKQDMALARSVLAAKPGDDLHSLRDRAVTVLTTIAARESARASLNKQMGTGNE